MAKISTNLTDTINQWLTNHNALSNKVGDLTLLTTSVDSDLVGAINSLVSSFSGYIRDDSDANIAGTVTLNDTLRIDGVAPQILMYDDDGTTQQSSFIQNGGATYIRSRNDSSAGSFFLQQWNGASWDTPLQIGTGGVTTVANGIVMNSASIGFNTTNTGIRMQTTNGADNHRLRLGGGGDYDWGRGATIDLNGNEHTNTGSLTLYAGDVSGGDVDIWTGAARRFTVYNSGVVEVINSLFVGSTVDVTGTVTLNDTLRIDGGTPTINLYDSDGTNFVTSIFNEAGSTYIRTRDSAGEGSIYIQQWNGATWDTPLRIFPSGNVSLTDNLTVNGDLTLAAAVTEEVYALSGTSVALDAGNGTVQTHTLSGSTTYTDSISAGQSIILMIDDGTSNTVSWPTMTWVNNGGAAPTLATSGYTVIAIWKVGSTLYGALIGDGS